MNIYLFVIFFTFLLATLYWYFFFKRNINKEWLFMFLYLLFSAIWMVFYYIYFSSIDDVVLLKTLSKVWYWSWIPCVFSFLLFIKYFKKNEAIAFDKSMGFMLFVYVSLMIIYCYTDLIIEWVVFDNSYWIYREIYWPLYPITYVFYGFFLVWIIPITKNRLLLLSSLDKKRLINIVFSTFMTIASLVVLQLILPLFWIWIFERQVIVIYLIYILYIYQTFRKYYFSTLFYWFWRISAFFLSAFFAIGLLSFIKYTLSQLELWNFHNYWNIDTTYNNSIDAVLVIIMYSMFHRFFSKIFLNDSWINKLKDDLNDFKKNISQITNFQKLNRIIQNEICWLFKAKNSYLIFFNEANLSAFQYFFETNKKNPLFINDAVFIEDTIEDKDRELFRGELNPDMYLIFPLYNPKNKCIWVFVLWWKLFGDFYTKSEIDLLISFTFFLEIHIKYIRTYTEMIDLSRNLDSRVDQKTIEYNSLINKQKEFISMISHEIRSPIWSTIFQVDSIINDIDNKKSSLMDTRNSIHNIWDQLANIWELLKKLFSVQYFDTRDVILLKEKVLIWNLLEKEFDIYSRMYENITFIKNISPAVWFVNIDKIHFHQVITNLLENAIKFADPIDPIIIIECECIEWEKFRINIEDNGPWYWDIDPSVLFEKYAKGQHSKLWLWMWLYLCKRIVTMHSWDIVIHHGKILKWASFVIEVPI